MGSKKGSQCRYHTRRNFPLPLRGSAAKISRHNRKNEKLVSNDPILLAKTYVSDAFRNVRVSPENPHQLCNVLEDIVMVDLRLAFGWTGSQRIWGSLASAIEHAHCHSTTDDGVLLPEVIEMMVYLTMIEA